jgi:hypothetical protein
MKKPKSLDERRLDAAQRRFERADVGEVAGLDGWTQDGDFYSIGVYWENEDGGDSIFGSFGVEFKPNSTKIIDEWANY